MIWGPVFPNVEGEGIPSKIKLFDASCQDLTHVVQQDGLSSASTRTLGSLPSIDIVVFSSRPLYFSPTLDIEVAQTVTNN